jgi:hypothetical protein
MRVVIRRILWAVALVCLAGNAPAAFGGYGDGVTAIEKAQLPRFCWKQMEIPNAEGPEFTIPASCGVGMNHYCGGLVYLIRAKSAAGKAKRLSLLGLADEGIRYTEQWMNKSPNCPIRGHLEASKAEVDNLRRIYGGAQSKTPATPK